MGKAGPAAGRRKKTPEDMFMVCLTTVSAEKEVEFLISYKQQRNEGS